LINQLPATFAALSDPTRFRVVEILSTRDLPAGELASQCSVSGPAMSRHLRVLRRTGLVEVVHVRPVDDDARLRIYRLRHAPFLSVKDWVDQMQAFWNGQLNAFKTYAERTRT
jgi:DNA-binding transcriptional ArsR family regulator